MPDEEWMSVDARFQRYLDEGRFMIQRARRSGLAFYYPRVAEPLTGNTEVEWFSPTGLGTVYSTTVVRTRPPVEPYNFALIDLDEGPRVGSRVVGMSPEDVAIGMRVKARIDQLDGKAILVFEREGLKP